MRKRLLDIGWATVTVKRFQKGKKNAPPRGGEGEGVKV